MKNTRESKNARGFTLIEVVIVIAVMGIFGLITTDMLANATKIYSSSIKHQKFISESRSSFNRMLRDISTQKNHTSFFGSSLKKINISTSQNELMDYELSNDGTIRTNNSLIPSADNEVLTDVLNYSSSNIYYFNKNKNIINPEQELGEIEYIEIDLSFNYEEKNMRFKGISFPYNFRLGTPMSFHE
tara:strand:+ start:159 stop:719 length:561 start_codon:yes stop_codon:yes gene_type:complete